MDYKAGERLEIEFYDHYTSEDKSSKESVEIKPLIVYGMGRYLGETPLYVNISGFFIGIESQSNDVLHIFKKAIIKISRLKQRSTS